MHNFRKVLLTTLAFLLLLALMSVGFMEIYFESELDSFQDCSERDALAGSLDYLVCGASHAYRAFDPAVMDPILGEEGYNISGALMTMGGRYEMLRGEASRNPVKTLYLEVSYNTMTRNRVKEGTEGDLYVMARLPDLFQRTRFFFTAFQPGEHVDVYKKFLTEGMEAGVELLKGSSRPPSNRSRGYLPTGPRTMEMLTDYASVYHKKSVYTVVDPYNEEYLDKILTYCRDQGIEVVLVVTPLSKDYLCRYDNFQYFYDYYAELAERWGLRYYDYNLLKERYDLLTDEADYFDQLHLNDAGAKKFSRLFAELEVRARAGEDLSDLFYGSYAEMETAVFGLS